MATSIPEHAEAECPVCLNAMPNTVDDRVFLCKRHPLCPSCADRMYERLDHRCPLCRADWFENDELDDELTADEMAYINGKVRRYIQTLVKKLEVERAYRMK